MAFTMTFALLLILASSVSLLLHSLSRHRKHPNLPPGPYNLPIIGNLHRLGALPHRFLDSLSRKHGPLMFLKLGGVPTVVASSPDTVKEFLKTHDLECCSRPRLTALDKLSYGSSDIGFAPYGDQWRELRKICIINLFSSKKVAQFRCVREEEMEAMIDSIASRCGHSCINLSEELSSVASNITCRTTLGERYYSGHASALRGVLAESQAMFGGLFFADYIPMLGWLDWLTGMRSRLEKKFRELDGFYQRMIDEHLDAEMKRGERSEDTIDVLLDMKRKEAHVTDNHIKGVLMNIFSAGSEPSAAVTEWVMTELMRNPEAMTKAQNEVRGLLGNKQKIVTESDLNQLPYMKCVIKETLRLHPPVPLLLQRETMQDCKINGYDVPAKTRLLINTWAIARSEDVWESPDKFYPERFMGSHVDFRGHDFELIPFGAGRRICPGMNLGILVVELGLANLLYCFDWKLPQGLSKEAVNIEEAPGLTVHKKYALSLVATRFMGAGE